ncbi:ADP-ribosylglycohydrolase family protein [candidate division KSB1 bacterium]|nr:ADP-ribosylglycohydrolase family protein [candidate division KSB1 bacterium]
MERLILNAGIYRDKVQACWLGKNIGGTLGGPWEGKRHTHALTFYDPLPTQAAPNDDLDLQLVWLKMLTEAELDPSVRTFATYWQRYAIRYPWNEYGFFMRNFNRGLRPPIAGCFENYFVDEMGAPIRSEIWACLHPADPQAAARLAWKDACLDHAGGEGVYGEMFWAAVEAAAFVETDPHLLIQIGLNMIPLSSHLARAIREAVWCYEQRQTWGEARERIASRFGHLQPCNAVPNHGFIILGWLYGRDFGDCLCKAVNCGYDTDCTGATLGALLGILNGAAGIPSAWQQPIGEEIVLHKFTGDCGAPKTISELAARVSDLGLKAAQAKDDIVFGPTANLPRDYQTRLFRNDLARQMLQQDLHCGVELLPDGREICFHYHGEPVLRPKIGKTVHLTIAGDVAPRLNLVVPDAWQCQELDAGVFQLYSEGPIAPQNQVQVEYAGAVVTFTLLGPTEARGFPAGANVPTCPGCGARLEACFCAKT